MPTRRWRLHTPARPPPWRVFAFHDRVDGGGDVDGQAHTWFFPAATRGRLGRGDLRPPALLAATAAAVGDRRRAGARCPGAGGRVQQPRRHQQPRARVEGRDGRRPSAAQLVAFWELHRIVLRTDRWFDVAVPHLVGNAASHVAPGGSAVGAGVQARLMTTAGFSLARTMTAFGAIAIIGGVANYVVLPLVVLGRERGRQQRRRWTDLGDVGRRRDPGRTARRRCRHRPARCAVATSRVAPCRGSTRGCTARRTRPISSAG